MMKRQETNNWSLQGAAITGHHHLDEFTNGQDAFAAACYEDNQIGGCVTDGCGSSDHSEIGAWLVASYVNRQIDTLFKQGCPPESMPKALFHAVLQYIQMELHLHCDPMDLVGRASMIKEFWLCSIIGLAQNNSSGVIFWSGDPTFAIDDQLTVVDEDNHPHYIAYSCLVDPAAFGVGEDSIPTGFHVVTYDPRAVNGVMISSDGFTTSHDIRLAKTRERKDLPESLHGSQWGIKGKIGLKLWLNKHRSFGFFDDDCGIVVVERKPHDSQSGNQ